MRYAPLTLLIATSVAASALAQDQIRRSQDGSELRGEWVIGATVTTPDGETIGAIDDLLLDQEEGTVTAAIVSVGGFLGFGAKQIAVDWNELDQAYDGNEVTLSLSREEAEEASAFSFREREAPPPPPAATGGQDGGLGGDTPTAPPPE